LQNLFSGMEAEPNPELASGEAFARIAVERGLDAPESADGLTYRTGGLQVAVGQRVLVPLGRGNKPVAGIVVAIGGPELLWVGRPVPGRQTRRGPASHTIKPILKVAPGRLPDQLIALAQWMADYYICPLGMVLATMLPAAVKHGTGLRSRTLLARADQSGAGVSTASGVIDLSTLKPSVRKAWEAIQALDDPGPWEPRLLAAKIAAPNLAPLNRLLEAGLLTQVEREEVRSRQPLWEQYCLGDAAAAPPVDLTPSQRRIAEGISTTLGAFSIHLLRGITGSGKTEVYMQVIRRVIDRGQTALVLVPEISLTPQTAGRFIDRFRDAGAVAVLHSGLTASQRHKQWALAASGQACIAVGARSAVFAPIPNLGLIVVDEEHATDYKQDQLPRYSGRDVAIKRGQLESCPVLLGSATPSLESWASATCTPPRSKLWELTERVGGGTLPRVEIVDLREERRAMAARTDGKSWQDRAFAAIGPRLHAALATTLAAGGQAILLLNRRGYSTYIACPAPSCGWIMHCDDCDAAMVLHRRGAGVSSAIPTPAGELLRCHHCLAEQVVPVQCPLCRRPPIAIGAGTQRLEEELARKFPDLSAGQTMVRVDGDTMRSAKDYFDCLARFGAGDIKVLLGTQMISKGLDFPNVRLVGVINADVGLALPDFRAAERTFQLISQVAGRTGRGQYAGRVLVQTADPAAPCIVRAAAHDYIAFAQEELALRRRSGLPPAMRMARIVIRDEDFDKARLQSERMADLLLQSAGPRARILGPGPCPISRIAGQFRFGIELLAPTAPELHTALARLRAAGLLKSDAHTAVDVDPVALA
jgi:primosomal protein N' (replication factor Y) (superfamily II helicase)